MTRLADELKTVRFVEAAMPMIDGQALATTEQGTESRFAQVFGLQPDDLRQIELVTDPEEALGSLDEFGDGRGLQVAVGSGLARQLGLYPGAEVTLVTPKARTSALGNAGVRRAQFEVVYVFQIGISIVDDSLVYMPFDTAQSFFVKTEQRYMSGDGQIITVPAQADTIAVLLVDPEATETAKSDMAPILIGKGLQPWSWKDANGSFIAALNTERIMMFVILSLLVIIAVLNIITGLVMLVKNKGRDIAILRTMGLSRGGVMRVFLMCGGTIGVFGTIAGVAAGIAFALNIQSIMELVAWVTGQNLWDPAVRQLTELPAKLRGQDIAATVVLSLSCSFLAALLPARRAARLDPVEALRNE